MWQRRRPIRWHARCGTGGRQAGCPGSHAAGGLLFGGGPCWHIAACCACCVLPSRIASRDPCLCTQPTLFSLPLIFLPPSALLLPLASLTHLCPSHPLAARLRRDHGIAAGLPILLSTEKPRCGLVYSGEEGASRAPPGLLLVASWPGAG